MTTLVDSTNSRYRIASGHYELVLIADIIDLFRASDCKTIEIESVKMTMQKIFS